MVLLLEMVFLATEQRIGERIRLGFVSKSRKSIEARG